MSDAEGPRPRSGGGAGWKGAVGLALSVVLVWWTLRGVPLGEVWARVVEADLLLLGGAIFVATAGFLVRALRWKVLLETVAPGTSLHDRWAAVNIGFMANNLLPARIGEFARAWALSERDPRVSMSGAFGSLVVERILDAVVLILLLAGAILSPGFPRDALGPRFDLVLRGAAAFLAVGALGLGILLFLPRPVVRAVESVARRLPATWGRAIIAALEAFLDALQIVRSARLLTLAFLWSLGFWLFNGLSFWLGMLAFGIDAGFVAAYFTEAVVGFAVALPAAPGFVGTFHAGATVALHSVYGVAEDVTAAFAYGYHLGGFVPVTLIGLWYVRSLGLSLGEVRASEVRVEEAVEEAHPDPDER